MKLIVVLCSFLCFTKSLGSPLNQTGTTPGVIPTANQNAPEAAVSALSCYACNSGWEACGVDGITAEDLNIVGKETCAGSCFVRLDKSGYTYRGCTDGFPNLKDVAKDGCMDADESSYGYTVEEWCFCSTDLCNNVGMTDLGGNGAVGPTPNPDLPCEPLEIPSNAYLVEEVGNAVRMACDPGYVAEGSRVRRCRKDGTWTGSDLRCLPKTCRPLLDIVWVVDTSCSIAESNLEKMHKFVEDATNLLDIGRNRIRVGAVSYNNGYQDQFYLNSFRTKTGVMDAIRSADRKLEGCKTHTWLALKALREVYFTAQYGARAGVKKIGVVLSDGFTYPTKNRRDTVREAKLNNDQGIETFVVGVPNKRGRLGTTEWNAIASDPKEDHVFQLSSFDQLQEVVQVLKTRNC